jgi:hypothetical protein
VSNALRRVPLTPEMHVFQAEISRNQRVVFGWDTQNGSVIANSCNEPFAPGSALGSEPSDSRNQLFFG